MTTLSGKWDEIGWQDNASIWAKMQCKDCALLDDGTDATSNYTNGYCSVYPYSKHDHTSRKPRFVMRNTALCEHYKKAV